MLALIARPALRAQTCHFSGETNLAETRRTLAAIPTCASANAYLHRCAWGSSADSAFARVVMSKCEASFLPTLPAPAKARYSQEQKLCGYALTPDGGTLQLSEAALCSADVAANFAKNPAAADKWQPLRASFPCSRARSPLEKATCANATLGTADIAMARSYRVAEHSLSPTERPAFIQQQKGWQASVIAQCNITTSPAPPQAVSCATDRYKSRIGDLQACLDDPDGCRIASH